MLKDENFTEAGFLFDKKDEVEIALMKSSENLTGERYDISLKPADNGEYVVTIVSKHDGFNTIIKEHIDIGNKKMSMRLQYNKKHIPVILELTEKFTNCIMNNP